MTAAHVPALDGLRALAVLPVLALHASYGNLPGGFLGVDLFFALSGFLITRLLATEHAATGTISVRDFYRRRALRLVPAMIGAVLLAGALWPFTANEPDTGWLHAAAAVLGYYANYDFWHLGSLAPAWSLAVEGQFYLVWPAVVVLLLARRWPLVLVPCVIGLGSAVLRAALVGTVPLHDLYVITPTRVDSLMAGALGAMLLGRLPRPTWLAVPILALFAIGTLTVHDADVWLYRGGFTLVAVLATWLVVLVATAPADTLLARVLSLPWLRWTGTRSYGLYLYHFPLFLVVEPLRVPHDVVNFALVTVLRFALAFLVAGLSYRYLESPFRRYTHRPMRAGGVPMSV